MKRISILFLVFGGSLSLVNAQWQSTFLAFSTATCLATSGSTLFAGTPDAGMYRSSDNGVSWTQVNSGLTDMYVNDILVNGSDIFAATSGGIFRSDNNGASWTPTGYTGATSSLAMKGSNIFAGTNYNGVQMSSDNGATWVARSSGLTSNISTVAANTTNVFAGFEGGSMSVYTSTNDGVSWVQASSGITAGTWINTMTTNGSSIFAGATYGLYYSANNGSSWTEQVDPDISNTVLSILEYSPYVFIGGTFGCVSMSTLNPGTWISVNTGLPYSNILALCSNGMYIFAGTYGDGVYKRLITEFTGIEDNVFNKDAINCSPNPAEDIITVQYSTWTMGDLITLSDLNGRQLFQQPVVLDKTEINISGLAKGVYLVRVLGDDVNVVKKIIKK